MSAVTRSQNTLKSQFTKNHRKIFNFIPKHGTPAPQQMYLDFNCHHDFDDCETQDEIILRIHQLHLHKIQTDLIDCNNYYPNVKTCAFTGEIYGCPDWLAMTILAKCAARDKIRGIVYDLTKKLTEYYLETGLMPKPCAELGKECHEPCGMIGRSWWKTCGYNGPCGCAWKEARRQGDIENKGGCGLFVPSIQELEYGHYLWDMKTYNLLR